MAMNAHDVAFAGCEWKELHPLVAEHLQTCRITVDSFWEDHVLESNHYKMTVGNEIVGYFSIHGEHTLVLFHVSPAAANLSQALFLRAKQYECVTNAMVATGDEVFLSHCLDSFARIEKQAYLAAYTEGEIPQGQARDIALRPADIAKEEDLRTLTLSGDFLNGAIACMRDNTHNVCIYIAALAGETVGFGVIEYGRVLQDIASIGMFVCQEHRCQGIGSSILQGLKGIARDRGCRVFSGCWYYNHNSKKSMERAGAYAKTRLIRFYF